MERVWRHGDKVVFKFAGVDSISDAEKLEDADVCIPLEERAVLPEGEYYQSDLVGCEVTDRVTGKSLGIVEDWKEYGGPPLLEVKGADDRVILIPFAKSIFQEIDLVGKRVLVDLPEGLDEL